MTNAVESRASVDPRIELLGLVQRRLEGGEVPWHVRLLAPGMARYLEASARFAAGAIADDEAAALGALLKEPGQWFSAARLLLKCGPLPGLEFKGQPGQHEGELLERLRGVAARSGFEAFFASHAAGFEAWTAALSQALEGDDPGAVVADYLGVSLEAGYRVVLTPTLRRVPLGVLSASEGRFEDRKSVV